MALLRIYSYSIVILILQLYGGVGKDLPKLLNNKLLVGPARYETAFPLYKNCFGKSPTQYEFKISSLFKPREVLKDSIFKRISFTSAIVHSALDYGGIGKLTFTEVKHESLSAYVLHLDPTGDTGEKVYWLPQGHSIDIERTPAASDPKYVFTQDFSGCSWTVTTLDDKDKLRLRHVCGGKEPQFNYATEYNKDELQSYAMQYKDYGYIELNNKKRENAMAYAYMHFSNGTWSLYIQQKTCAPMPQQPIFNKFGKLKSIKFNYANKPGYNMISGAKVFRLNFNTKA